MLSFRKLLNGSSLLIFLKLRLRKNTKNTERKKAAVVGDGQINGRGLYAYFLGAAKSLSPLCTIALLYSGENQLRICLVCLSLVKM